MGLCHSKAVLKNDRTNQSSLTVIEFDELSRDTIELSSSSLEEKFKHLLNTKLNNLYLENFIRKTVLPERKYLDLALDLILKINVTASYEEKKFAMLVATYTFNSNSENSDYINQINSSLLPSAWQEDFLMWEKLCKNESVSCLSIADNYLKSWKMMCLGIEYYSASKLHDNNELQHYENALQINFRSIKAIINLIYTLTHERSSVTDFKRAEEYLQKSLMLFEDNPIVTCYLNAKLAHYVYMPQYLENFSSTIAQKISALKLSVDEPYMKSKSLIYRVRGIDANRNAWYYVRVVPSKVNAFLEALKDPIIHLRQYGSILTSGYGDEPPAEVTNNIKRKYFLDQDDVSMPNVLQRLLETTYATHAEQRKKALSRANANNASIQKERIAFGRLLGQGAYGKVYQCTLDNSKTVAVKCYEGLNLPEKALAEALHEIEVMQSLQHAHLVSLLGYNAEPSSPILVMEYGENGSLYQLLHSHQTITWALRLRIALDISLGLEYLHSKNYVHRDIKSLNVILFGNNRAKLSDFGLSRLKLHSSTQSTDVSRGHTTPAGSLLWMASELFLRATATPSTKSDVYSFGMVLFELASRLLPFHDAKDENQAIEWIKQGTGENVPDECERSQPQFAALMKFCWLEKNQRPTASEIVQSLALQI